MRLIDKMLILVGKENFRIDHLVGRKYLAILSFKYILMIIRGRLFSIMYKDISNDILVGNKIKVLEKGKLFIGKKTKIYNNVYIDALSTGGVHIGKKVVIGENSRIECTGSISCVGKGITIGDRTTFGANCIFGAAGGIDIGNDVIAGQMVRFHSENHNYSNLNVLIKDQGVTHKGIKIGNNCWIGAGAVFLDGSRIGDGCVVAANAVITKSFPNNVVIAGVPAKIISYRG